MQCSDRIKGLRTAPQARGASRLTCLVRAWPALQLLLLSWASSASASEIAVCFDDADHTPYLFKDSQGTWRGAALDLAHAAIERAGLRVVWLPMPWIRCLREAANPGTASKVEIALYGSLSAEREELFLATVPLHQTQGGVWYSKSRHATLQLKAMDELAAFRLCGMHGHNYTWLKHLGIAQIDTGALTLRAAIRKLQLDRCDLVLSSREQVEGADLLGQLELPADLWFMPFPQRKPVAHHILLSKLSSRGLALKTRLDKSLSELHGSGAANEVYQRYVPSGTGVPLRP